MQGKLQEDADEPEHYSNAVNEHLQEVVSEGVGFEEKLPSAFVNSFGKFSFDHFILDNILSEDVADEVDVIMCAAE
ncbi:hypothetical protein TNIN_79841 [Trichonephila inaurata madagascariensis]|uniref:Uncharacterized protein n=1 Tax=Trichonephila inaurata madagascariensis TaxID=2747483 RepID=A0A8X6X7G6_9ARAC|nr:hypothetical protein TNIN_79841 [Trichonephila inaurata madagascariensis]